MIYHFSKNIFDKIFSLILILILIPIFLLLIILNLSFNGMPIFYIQERSGKDKKKFNLIKLRTINVDNKDLSKISYTNFGLFFRKSGLDELFQLFNILKGDLSFVGPRPLYVKYDDLYDQKQIKRMSIKPGLTGLAQINQFNDITWEEKIQYDLIYVENMSFLLDIKIIFKTFYKLLFRVFDKSFSTISNEFEGNKKNEKF